MREVVAYLERTDPAAAARARRRYACFDQHNPERDGQSYGYAAAHGWRPSCERQVVDQLLDLRRHSADLLRRDGATAAEEQFYAERNAATVRDAENYYRAMYGGRVSSWNLRDTHMAQTLDALLDHLDAPGAPARVVVWAHNSHVADARATEMGAQGQLTLGQLARESLGPGCRLVGMTTHSGTVTAASAWGGDAELKQVVPALPSSVETLLQDTGLPSFLVRSDAAGAAAALRDTRLHRAIGVVYRPDTERQSHYFHARVGDMFDAVIHIGKTTALRPLEPGSTPAPGQTPETYPTGL